MWIYISFLFLPIVFQFISNLNDKNLEYLSKHLFLIFAIFLIGSRYIIGGDWAQYNEYFNASAESDLFVLLSLKGPSYAILNHLVSVVGGSIVLVNLVSAFILIYGLNKFCKDVPNYWDAYLISIPYLLIVVAMGYTRQSIAMGFVFLALSFYKDSNRFKYIVAVLAGSTFHVACVIMLPFSYFFTTTRRNIEPINLTVGFFIVILIIFIISFNYQYILKHYVSMGRVSSGAYFRLFIHSIVFISFLIVRRKYQKNYDDYKLWVWIGVSPFLILPIAYISSTIYDRLIIYFLPFQILILSRFIYLFKMPLNRIFFRMCVYLSYSLILIVWLNFANNRGNWLPYQSVIFQ